MYLKIGGVTRPFNEADASISYTPVFDGSRRIIKIHQVWQIDGVVVQQTNATQTNMTAKLEQLRRDFSQDRPDLVFLEDDGVTPSALELLASVCLQGPELTNFSFPKNANKVYSNGHPYTATMEADVWSGAAGNPILEFEEEVIDEGSGGWERVHVGGAINLPEEQIGTQYAPWRYTQSGTSLGLYTWPNIPPPIWPAMLKKPYAKITRTSPEVLGTVDQRFRISWSYSYESRVQLFGGPHRLVV